jgi:hypothetical protein
VIFLSLSPLEILELLVEPNQVLERCWSVNMEKRVIDTY